MESLSETTWDVVLCRTGLQQSLLALALSRSDKKILHVDPNEYYGGPEAAFSLQEAERWAAAHASPDAAGTFRSASFSKATEDDGLSFSRAYSLSLSPAFIHARSNLLSQLVSSRAFRQLEFLAVGSFFIYNPPSNSGEAALTRIPSTREAVFSSAEIPTKAKRSLMKFLKFVLEYDSEDHVETWKARADEQLEVFLESEFKLDEKLRAYIITLTLSQSGKITVEDGLWAIHRHMTSMGMFGPGFAALYPKWGGGSEIAQVGCRAGAVGGGVYMLGTGIKEIRQVSSGGEGEPELEIDLESDVTIKARTLVRGQEIAKNAETVSRLVAVVGSSLRSLFEAVVEGSPTPAVAVIAFPSGSLQTEDGSPTECPVYVVVHSSDTGECPTGQSILHISAPTGLSTKALLEKALSSVLAVLSPEETPKILCQLSYEQAISSSGLSTDGSVLTFSASPPSLAFDDSSLDPVRRAWDTICRSLGEDEPGEYMIFEDREGADAEDDPYE